MVRLELIANRSVEDDLYDLMKNRNISPDFTKFAEVQGRGNSGPRRGDHIFPEENFVLVMYCDDASADGIASAVGELKSIFPAEGIRLYRSTAERVC
jgi:hypothetical protein